MARAGKAATRDAEAPNSESPDTEHIDFAWDEGYSATLRTRPPLARLPSTSPRIIDPLPPPREAMPTLNDEDPLRYDLLYDRERDVTRDSMPTIPDSDPLRHDVVEPANG